MQCPILGKLHAIVAPEKPIPGREKFCPQEVWKGKKEIWREAPKKFLAYIFSQ
jgi:hypothetical protein